jgi:acetolactate synthase-1/3 small subunit
MDRLGQMVKHLKKLEDVFEVERHGADHGVFERLEAFFQ